MTFTTERQKVKIVSDSVLFSTNPKSIQGKNTENSPIHSKFKHSQFSLKSEPWRQKFHFCRYP